MIFPRGSALGEIFLVSNHLERWVGVSMPRSKRKYFLLLSNLKKIVVAMPLSALLQFFYHHCHNDLMQLQYLIFNFLNAVLRQII